VCGSYTSRQSSKAGTVSGNAARTALCGAISDGRPCCDCDHKLVRMTFRKASEGRAFKDLL
jgi:hypothetical protein